MNEKKMGVVYWVFEKFKFGEEEEQTEFEFFADEKGAKKHFDKLLGERKSGDFFGNLLNEVETVIEEEEDYFGLHYEGIYSVSDYELYIECFDVHPPEGGDENDA